MMLLALLAAAVAAEGAQVPFTPLASFDTEAACDARLTQMAAEARAADWVAVEGPYTIAFGDRRIHMVRIAGSGHGITERRCLARELSTRSWEHSMGPQEPAATVEDMAARAEWLKKR